MSKPVFSDLFRLSGRRNRKSYFMFLIAVVAVQVGLTVIGGVVSASDVLVGVVLLAHFMLAIPFAIVAAQRCRDFGWTGWAVLIALIPIVGAIFGLAIIFIPGTLGPNRYGPDPLGPEPVPAAH
ncbi:MAG: DUF805 domain-containing protein [Alphaproteobacteria bacterium]|nr:DUF805 domain-containing protein [Alphaproteobacteria bacterium]